MKGKHAVSAANRRDAAARERIATLEAALTEAKARARKAERDAEAIPALRAEITRLQTLNDESTSDALEELRDEVEALLADYADRLHRTGMLVLTAAERERKGMEHSEWAELVELTGLDLSEAMPEVFGYSRTSRRNAKRFAGHGKALATHFKMVDEIVARFGAEALAR